MIQQNTKKNMCQLRLQQKDQFLVKINTDQAQDVLKEKLHIDNNSKRKKLNKMYQDIITPIKKVMRHSMLKLPMGKHFSHIR